LTNRTAQALYDGSTVVVIEATAGEQASLVRARRVRPVVELRIRPLDPAPLVEQSVIIDPSGKVTETTRS
jgi:hypothetical protein